MSNEEIEPIGDTLNDEATCPYCEQEISDSCETVGNNDGDTETIECNCGKKFVAVCHISVEYSSEPDCELNGDECIPEYKSHCDAYFCKRCEKILRNLTLEKRANK